MFTYTLARAGTRACLTLAGEIDCRAHDALRDAVDNALAGHPAEVRIDLSAVTFMDGGGAGILSTGYRKATSAGVHLVVANPRRLVRRVLAVLDLLGTLAG